MMIYILLFTAMLLIIIQPPLKKEIRSLLSFPLASPAKAIPLPGANSAGDFSHLSKFPSVHLSVALDASADE